MLNSDTLRIDIFKGLRDCQLGTLNSWLERREFPKNSVILKEGQLSDGMYVLVSGSVRVVKQSAKGRFALAALEAPSFFGELGLLIGEKRTATVMAATDVIAGFLPSSLFLAKVEAEDPMAMRLAYNIARVLSHRLHNTSLSLARAKGVAGLRAMYRS